MKRIVLTLVATMLLASCGNTGKKAQESTPSGITSPVIETIMARRSIRAYKPVPVSRDTMRVILECGINAPNAMNAQNWEVRVVDDAATISEVTKAFVAQNPKMAEDKGFVNMFRNAPAVVFVANKADGGMSQIDCGLLGENIVLSAASLGLGTCCLGGPVRFILSPEGKFFLDKLGFSEGYELLYAIAVGYPAESPEAKPRIADKVRFVD